MVDVGGQSYPNSKQEATGIVLCRGILFVSIYLYVPGI